MPTPEIISLTRESFEKIKEEVTNSNLSSKTIKLVIGVMQLCLWLQEKLTQSKISIAKLKKIFGIKTEKHKSNPSRKTNDLNFVTTNDEPNSEDGVGVDSKNEEALKKRKGHGRLSAEQYTNATDIRIDHPDYIIGQACPSGCPGKLREVKDRGIFIRIEGGSLFNVKRYDYQMLRCDTCGEIHNAPLPEHVTEKYDEKAKSVIAVLKYQMGMPLYRLADWQKRIGQPIPDTTQWELILQIFPVVQVIYDYLITLAAQSPYFFQDDTTLKILSVMKMNELSTDKKSRKGMFTTGIIGEYEKNIIHLFFSGTQHAGENLSDVLSHRDPTLPTPFQMCDPLSSNFVDECMETLLCHCLIHGRRQFFEIKDFFQEPCNFVLDQISEIYKNEADCQKQNFSPEQRLLYHQEKSWPPMNKLKIFMQEQIDKQLAEPNAPLAKACRYWLRRFDKLSKFLTHKGAPIDNNIIERGLKLAIRIRKSSLFHKTTRGAFVAGAMMSVIYTTLNAGIDPIEYLTVLQKQKEKVLVSPYDWLPWNYQKTQEQPNQQYQIAA